MKLQKDAILKFLGSNLLPLAIVFAALVPVYQARVQDAIIIADLKRDVAANNEQIQEVAEANPEAEETAKLIELNRYSILEAKAATKTILDRRFEMESGMCSKYVRQTVEFAHQSTKYAYLFGASAKISANLFLASPYGYLWPQQKAALGGVIQPGDILFKRKGSGGYGHVGIYVGDIPGIGKQLVAENSSTSIGRIQGAKGYRTLAQYNSDNGIDVIGRLPLPASYVKATVAKAPRLIVGARTGQTLRYTAITGAQLASGRWSANSAKVSTSINRKAATSKTVVVVDFLKSINSTPYAYGQHLGDKSNPRTYLFIDTK